MSDRTDLLGPTSKVGMENLRREFDAAQQEMRDAFVEVLSRAQESARDADALDEVNRQQRRFWTARGEVRRAFAIALLTAALRGAPDDPDLTAHLEAS